MKTRYVLDTCALLAVLYNEEGADFVSNIINSIGDDTSDVSIHKANLIELYYEIYRIVGKTATDKIIDDICSLPITVISGISDELVMEAGRMKATYKISFADSFALATASILGASLVTADHHEMDAIAKSGEMITFEWIR